MNLSHRKHCSTALLFVVSLLGCGRSQSQGRSAPGLEAEMVAAAAPAYHSPAGSTQECIGRLAFNIDRPVLWPTFYHPQMTEHWGATFSINVYEGDGMWLGQDNVGFGKVRIAVFDIDNEAAAKQIKHDLPTEKLVFYNAQIALAQDALRELRAEPATSKTPWLISQQEDRVKDYQESLAEAQAGRFPFTVATVNVEGFGKIEPADRVGDKQYSTYKAYLTRDGHIYVLESARELTKNLTKESHAAAFAALIKAFNTRAPGEVPTGPGICIPFGFFPDDGRVKSDIKQSFRIADAPNVLHTIRTGSFSNYRGNPPAMGAMALAATGNLGSNEEDALKPFITERIGPRSTKLGGLTATQGGFAARIAPRGEAPFEAYSVMTGYAGSEGSDELPFIVVEMNSKSAKAAPELKTNPPPFKVSMARHQALLQSVRLRDVKTSK